MGGTGLLLRQRDFGFFPARRTGAADVLAAKKGQAFGQDGAAWRAGGLRGGHRDKDLGSELLAEDVGADLLLMATTHKSPAGG